MNGLERERDALRSRITNDFRADAASLAVVIAGVGRGHRTRCVQRRRFLTGPGPDPPGAHSHSRTHTLAEFDGYAVHGHAVTGADERADGDSERHADGRSAVGRAHSHGCSDTLAGSDAGSKRDADRYADGRSDSDTHAGADADAHADTHAHAHAHAHAQRDSDAVTDADTGADRDARADADAGPGKHDARRLADVRLR